MISVIDLISMGDTNYRGNKSFLVGLLKNISVLVGPEKRISVLVGLLCFWWVFCAFGGSYCTFGSEGALGAPQGYKTLFYRAPRRLRR